MTLELNRLTGVVAEMGENMAERLGRLADKQREAAAVLARSPQVTEELRQKIRAAEQLDAWRRGATPLGPRLDEWRLITERVPEAILLAADGSQIFPDAHAAALWYLLNIGVIVFREGSGQAPSCESNPVLFYRDEEVYDGEGNVRSEEYIGAQRGRLELGRLTQLALAERAALGGDLSVPIVVLIDGPLLPWIHSANDGADRLNEEIDYFAGQMAQLRAARAIPIGYVDRPRSAYVMRILEIAEMPVESITRDALRTGRFLGLSDAGLFASLAPGERTGLFSPDSQANERYFVRSGGGSAGDRVAFCYANMARPGRDRDPEIARLEMPGWVAKEPALLDVALAVIAANCEPGPFPYVLARAHELALVGDEERSALESLLNQVLWRNEIVPQISTKAWTKQLTGSRRSAKK